MSSKRNMRRKACERKRRYTTQAEAVRSIPALRKKGKITELLLPYRCPFCKGFHFGHPPFAVRAKLRHELLPDRGGSFSVVPPMYPF